MAIAMVKITYKAANSGVVEGMLSSYFCLMKTLAERPFFQIKI